MKRIFQQLDGLYRWWLQPLLVLVILVVGFRAAMGLASSREAPPRGDDVRYEPVVRVMSASLGSHPVLVRGNGTLRARTRVDLVPQVAGEVLEIHPELRAGGHFRAGELLARIEPRDYELALASARADVIAAETALEIQTAEAEAARGEWERLHPTRPVPTLVGREPQIAEAKARLDAARSQEAMAELNLERTRLMLPFDGCVVSSSVDVGEVVPAGQPVGQVYGTDVFEVPVPLEASELRWLRLPGESGQDAGSAARVIVDGSEQPVVLQGRVVRLEGELDRTSRFARAVVEVRFGDLDPRLVARVLPGTFVDVEIEGGALENVARLPREALHENGVAWIVEGERLVYAPVEVVRSSGEDLLVRGLDDGALVVTSELEVVTDGMAVRVVEGALGQPSEERAR